MGSCVLFGHRQHLFQLAGCPVGQRPECPGAHAHDFGGGFNTQVQEVAQNDRFALAGGETCDRLAHHDRLGTFATRL